LPKNFFGKGIHSLTGIVGNNGAGKSTVMRYLLDAIVEGSAHDINGVIVYENFGEINVYWALKEKIKIKHDVKDKLAVKMSDNPPVINTFYYSGHFNPRLDYGDLTTIELGGLYNASEGFMLRGDFERFVNTSDKYLNFPISSYLVNHDAQNNYRICRLLIDKRVRNLLEKYVLPRYIHIVPNRGGQGHIKYHAGAAEKCKILGKNIDLPPIQNWDKEEYIKYFIHANLLNAISDNPAMDGHEEVLNQWRNVVDKKSDVLKQFREFADKQSDGVKQILLIIHEVISSIIAKANYNETIGSFYFDTVEDIEAVNSLISEASSSDLYLTSRFFDMYFSHSKDTTNMTLSSGEQEFLDLFSRIYDAVEIRPVKFENVGKPKLLLLDEAEIGFHPEWQRHYISVLLDFLRAIAVISEDDYQVVITSHSPILLSDIPSCCCNFLMKDEHGRTINMRGSVGETFAGNVFEQYRNSFFLKDGLVGNFAMDWLGKLNERVEKGGSVDRNELELIGDERLKSYFRSYLNDDAELSKKELREYYQRKLIELGEQDDEQD
jgi:hypothetical protein